MSSLPPGWRKDGYPEEAYRCPSCGQLDGEQHASGCGEDDEASTLCENCAHFHCEPGQCDDAAVCDCDEYLPTRGVVRHWRMSI